MKSPRKSTFLILFIGISTISLAQDKQVWKTINLGKQTFELRNVKGELVKIQGTKALKLERDLEAFPFDVNNLEATVDDRHYARLLNLKDFENGTIEVKMLSQLQNPAPYPGIAGFIGLYFRVTEDDSQWESIYLRPKVGRSDDQFARNHTVQYFSYPNHKFQTLRNNFPAGTFESSAPVALNEWITMRIEVNGERAEMFINNMKHSSLIVKKMLGKTKSGYLGLYVDIGTIGYFKDLKIIKKEFQAKKESEKIEDI